MYMERLLRDTIKLFTQHDYDVVNEVPLFIRPKKYVPDHPCVLIVAGVHGNEPAGVFAAIDSIVNKPANVSFMPIVNTNGLVKNIRFDESDADPNRGYMDLEERKSKLVERLVQLRTELMSAGRDGLLSLHEDPDNEKFFIYAPNRQDVNWKRLLDVARKHFEIVPDGMVDDEFVVDGLVEEDYLEGTLEDWLMALGVKYVYTTETPGKKPIDERIACAKHLLSEFYSLMEERYHIDRRHAAK
jgi:predicted deacylase